MGIVRILTQEEVDLLLRGLSDDDSHNGVVVEGIEELEHLLTERKWEPEKPYGIFTGEVSMLRFFKDRNSEKILADIKAKNQAEGMGAILIPGTEIELINYSYCPRCREIHSMADLMDYYAHPRRVPRLERCLQLRTDTRVSCKSCREFFFPALVISDGSPCNEAQFLCRVQTINAVEELYQNDYRRPVLSSKPENWLKRREKRGILNDVSVKDLTKRPTLLCNFLQYTPPDLMLSFLQGKNIENGDVVFGSWS